MTQPPPLPPGIGSSFPSAPLPRKFRWRYFFIAFAIGTIISAITWIGGWDAIDKGNLGPLILIVPAVKIIAAIVMVCSRQTRSAGVGLFASIPVGFGIFFGVCVNNLNFH